jgi:hypothetical protein
MITQKKVWENQLEGIFKKHTPTELEIILKTIPLILYQNSEDIDLISIYNNFGLDNLIKFCKLFNGKTVKSYRESEIKETIHFSLVYYYRIIKKLDWKDIRRILPFKVNSISFALKIKKLESSIKVQLEKMLKEIK